MEKTNWADTNWADMSTPAERLSNDMIELVKHVEDLHKKFPDVQNIAVMPGDLETLPTYLRTLAIHAKSVADLLEEVYPSPKQ